MSAKLIKEVQARRAKRGLTSLISGAMKKNYFHFLLTLVGRKWQYDPRRIAPKKQSKMVTFLWYKILNINNKVAVAGMVVNLGIEKSEPIESSKKISANSEVDEHTEELERVLKIYNKNLPVIFVPRETNIEIVFPIEKN